jgi:REP element-mobilizing transposase RayT
MGAFVATESLVAAGVARISCSYERERVDFLPKGHLPRLPSEHYRGRAFVHWTLPTEHRATGWLTPMFHHHWRLVLLHTCARYGLLCPVYVLMPDHAHLVWIGLNDHGPDQRVAVAFLRKHLRPHLEPADWQNQTHDHVLREHEREHGAFFKVASYILDNPVRAGLVSARSLYPFTGGCVPGYPALDVCHGDYWERFWRVHNKLVDRR